MSGAAAVLVTGVALGAVYGLAGAAVATVAVTTRTLHLAIGQVLVAGVLLDLVLSSEALTGVPAIVGTLVAVTAGAVASALLVPLVLRPLPPGIAWLVGLAVAGATIEAVVARSLGTRTVRPEPLLPLGEVAGVDGAVVTALVVGVPMALLLSLLVARTRWGRRLRLVGGSHEAAELGGVSPLRAQAGAFALAGAVAVLAGLLVAPIAFAGVAQGAGLTVRAVAAAALLGRRGPGWALPAGAAIGVVEAAAQSAWPQAGGEVAVALLVVAILAIRGADARQAWGRAW